MSAQEIDKLGLTESVRLAMRRSLETISEGLMEKVVIDGNINYLDHLEGSQAVVGADGEVPEVSAASIVAKVSRDRWMVVQSSNYPGYGFELHKGYGTKKHTEALAKLGATRLHRMSFKPLRKFS